jgi:hypothetical protein
MVVPNAASTRPPVAPRLYLKKLRRPLMIGAKDLAFPRLNLLSWYIFIASGLLALVSLALGSVDTGWTFYPPYNLAFFLCFCWAFWACRAVVPGHARSVGEEWHRGGHFSRRGGNARNDAAKRGKR